MNKYTDEKINYANFWMVLSRKADSALKAGLTPILIIDLDGTLVDYTMRTYMIFREALTSLDLPDHIKKLVESIKREDYDYFPKTNFIKIGIEDRRIINQLTDFWNKNYFTNHYLHYDKQVPGAYDFVINVLNLGVDVVYLTGRDDQNMGEGTRAWLRENGFLGDNDSRRRLMMKMDLTIENFESKAKNGEAIGGLGQPVMIIDNEPIELQTMWERFPEALPVLMDMPNSGKPATLPENIFTIKDFLKLNAGFANK